MNVLLLKKNNGELEYIFNNWVDLEAELVFVALDVVSAQRYCFMLCGLLEVKI